MSLAALTFKASGMLSQQILYVIERIGDLFDLGIQIANDTKALIEKLQRELQRLHEYATDIEKREEQLEKKFSLGIEALLENAEGILDKLTIDEITPNDYILLFGCRVENIPNKKRKKHASNSTDCEIKDLLEKIEGYFTSSSSSHIYNFNTGNNQNFGGQQITGSINVRIDQSSPPSVRQVAGRVTYGHLPNRDLVGFHSELQTLLHHVIQNDQTQVVGIVGMGGSGKTTLAKYVYHHGDIDSHYADKVWICVSQSWDEVDIKYEILRQTEGVEREVIEKWSNQEFAEKLYEILSTQTYLIILDDMWDVDAWNIISPGIPPGKGSKIVVTSRKEDVIKRIDPTFFLLRPKPLNDDESYELFCQRTFIDGDLSSSKQLLDLGKEIVSKCDGLPLAITALAGVMGANKSLNHWQFVSQSLEERLTSLGDLTRYSTVKEVLALSYHDLPHNLQQCFLYLAIFPEDYEIQTGRLVKRWMAECLITHNDQLSDAEKMKEAKEYLDQLAQRYIIQYVERNYMGHVKTFQVHDLIRDMCIEKAKEKGFLKPSLRIDLGLTSTSWRQGQKQCEDTIDSILGPANSSRLRSLSVMHTDLSLRLLYMMQPVFNKFKSLRVFIIEAPFWEGDFVVPEAIGDLVHLRYLDLYANTIRLPHSFGNLQKLWTLDMRCHYDANTLKNLWKLKCLKHLYLSTSSMASYHDADLGQVLKLDKLDNLETLWVQGGSWMLSDMERLSPNIRKLRIFGICCLEHVEAVYRCPSILLGKLQTLTLEWKHSNAELQIDALRQCKNLRKLSLSGKIQESNDIPLSFPPNLIYLEMKFSQLQVTDPLAVTGDSLHCLEILILGRGSYMGTEMRCNASSFPELEKLELRGLYVTIWTIERDAMPKLKDLTFCQCYYLHQLEFLGLPNLKLRQVYILFPNEVIDFIQDFKEWEKQHPGIINRSKTYEFELPIIQDPSLNPGNRVKLINSRLLNPGRKNPFQSEEEEESPFRFSNMVDNLPSLLYERYYF